MGRNSDDFAHLIFTPSGRAVIKPRQAEEVDSSAEPIPTAGEEYSTAFRAGSTSSFASSKMRRHDYARCAVFLDFALGFEISTCKILRDRRG